jgi:divalent metal cation (Fe/Co/Zn/Cd) transporter
MEIYFWTFVVAVLVLLAGGVYSIYRGVSGLAVPHAIDSPRLSLAVLLLSAIFEGGSFKVGYAQYKKVVATHRVPGQSISLIQFIKLSKDPSLYESLLEDSAALAGLAVAAAGIVGSAYCGWLRADGAASLVIGTILVANGMAILIATRSLVAGEAVAPPVLRDLWSSVRGHSWSDRVSELATLHLGPSCVLVAVTLSPGTGSDAQLGHEIERRLQATDPRIIEVLFRFAPG